MSSSRFQFGSLQALQSKIRARLNLRPLSLANLLANRVRNDEDRASPDAREAYRMGACERLTEHEHARKKAEGRADVLSRYAFVTVL